MTIKTHAIVLACLIGLSGCGSGSDASTNSDDQRAVRELTKSLQRQEGRLQGLPPLARIVHGAAV